jgi:hypothetical protein
MLVGQRGWDSAGWCRWFAGQTTALLDTAEGVVP